MGQRGRKFETPDVSEIDADDAREREDSLAEEVKKKLQHGYIMDLKKPEFDHFERASILAEVLEDNGWSIREMADKFGIANSTLQDWLLWNNMDKKTYQKLIGDGLTHTQIYRELRDLRTTEGNNNVIGVGKSSANSNNEMDDLQVVDANLKKWEREVRTWINDDREFSEDTEENVNTLIATLEDFKVWMERVEEDEEDDDEEFEDEDDEDEE